MAAIKFGTDGWRAIIARDFTFANCRLVAQGIASYINAHNLTKKGLVIGYDNRFLSAEFAMECARVFLGNGVKVYFLRKPAPTPVAAFAIRVMQAGGALMVTASHNPAKYNGIKFIPEYAGPALPDITEAIENEIERVQETGKIYEMGEQEALQFNLYQEIDIDGDYIGHLQKLVQPSLFSKQPVKVVIDPMYGAGIGYLEKVLAPLGCEIRTINNYRDVLFGGALPEPTGENLADLKRAVLSYNADVGLALDGDADRFGIIDNEGHFVNANYFMALLLEHLLNTRTFRGPVARTVATTHMLDRIAAHNGLTTIETPVGFKYISECLREKGCILGGEESGGMSIYGHIPEKDGILACMLAVEMLAGSSQTFTELTRKVQGKYGKLVSERLDMQVEPQEKAVLLEQLSIYHPKSLAAIKVTSFNNLEGSKIVLEDGSWVLIRASGTEPVFRIYVETGEEHTLREIQTEVLGALGLRKDQ